MLKLAWLALVFSFLGIAPMSRASVFDQAPSIADAKQLASAIDAYLEMPADGKPDGGIDRVRMAQGLAESVARLGALEFNDMTQGLISDYLRTPEHRRDLETFVEILGTSSDKEHRGKVSRVGISAAEDALFFVTVLAALHGTPYAFNKLLGADGLVSGWVDPITHHRALAPVSRFLSYEWRAGKTLGGTLSFLPKNLWKWLVVAPNDAWFRAVAQPINRTKYILYPVLAATGVGHTLWQVYHDKQLDPRQALKLAQLRVLSGFATRVGDLRAKKTGELKVSENEQGFEDPALQDPSLLEAELAEMQTEVKRFAESASEEVREAANQLEAKIAEQLGPRT